MRAELPWNVAGIPPEAREAARAAARREGLSVGEWLTRRILRSFSDLGDDAPPGALYGAAPAGYGAAPLDSWGLPQSSAARRESEEMLARVSRSESESTESWRRIEEQLRGVSRRLDSSERSQSENNRVISRTAAEINVAAREQAQAFDQVSQTIVAINERLERLERERATDGVKDAVKALHQGLSRLADQIGQTANQSAAQVTAVTQTIDQLAYKLGQARDDASEGDRQLSERMAQADNRIGNTEKTVQFATNAIDHALEKLEALSQQRAGDQVEWQRRAGQTEEAIQRLEDSIIRLERSGDDKAVERRLDGIENSLHSLAARLEAHNPAAPLEETIRTVTRRLDTMERQQADLVNEMRANIMGAPASEPAFAKTPVFEAPPLTEPPPKPAAQSEPFLPPYGTDTFAPENFATGNFVETPDLESDDPFAPLNGMVEDAPGGENFLAAARRSAREAAEKGAAEKKGRFQWKRNAASDGRKSKLLPSLLVMAGVAALAVAAAVISSRLQHPAPKPAAQPTAASGQPFAPAPQVGTDNSQPQQEASNTDNGPPPSKVPQPVKPQVATSQPPRAAGGAPPTLERIAQLATQGNPIAETIVGIRFQGGTDGSASNPAEAFKWLSQAAAQGQPVAQYRLGTLYERGQGVAANPATAASWYLKAANAGNRLAMYNLAVALANKSLGQQNMSEAARWFMKAAGLGLVDAQFNLAVLYERGDGVPQNLSDAYKWYMIAAAAGDNGAQQRAAVLATNLSEIDRAAAAKSAQAFKPTPLNRAANVPPEPQDLVGQ
ncbi:MAG: SEL1-like repeat protein [Alphaproteobacteria bacterium]|nr:SEL1-like repeat protein [Alphaproteobacteria bacterium]